MVWLPRNLAFLHRLQPPVPVASRRPRSVEVGTDIGGRAKTGNKSLQGSISGQKEQHGYNISTFLLSSTDKYISGIWRIVARLTGDQMKGIRGKIRITVRVGPADFRYSQATRRISFLKRTTFIY